MCLDCKARNNYTTVTRRSRLIRMITSYFQSSESQAVHLEAQPSVALKARRLPVFFQLTVQNTRLSLGLFHFRHLPTQMFQSNRNLVADLATALSRDRCHQGKPHWLGVLKTSWNTAVLPWGI